MFSNTVILLTNLWIIFVIPVFIQIPSTQTLHSVAVTVVAQISRASRRAQDRRFIMTQHQAAQIMFFRTVAIIGPTMQTVIAAIIFNTVSAVTQKAAPTDAVRTPNLRMLL